MATSKAEQTWGGISDKAVSNKTGKDWEAWFKILDKDKADAMPHKEIAELLHDKHKVPGWWCQMLTVGYEQARGLRVKNQNCYGQFTVDISKVIRANLDDLYQAVANDTMRKKWLKEKVEIRKANESKSIRANFNGGTANLTFMFYEKGEGKAQVVINQNKLDNAAHVEERRKFWKEKITALEKILK